MHVIFSSAFSLNVNIFLLATSHVNEMTTIVSSEYKVVYHSHFLIFGLQSKLFPI